MSLLDDRIPKIIENHHYGDETRWWLGKCINNRDPDKLGRVQVRIFGIHSGSQADMPTSVLPWAQCLTPSTEGGVSGKGRYSKILPGAEVFGIMLDGKNSQCPLVLGTLHYKENGSGRVPKHSNAGRQDRVYDPRGPHQIPGYDSGIPNGEIDTALSGGTNAEKIFNFFTAQGFQPNQAAAFVGNFYAESNLDPKALNPNDKGKPAFGIAQWRGSRYDDLITYSEEVGLPPDSLTTQLNFVMHELNTTESQAHGKIRASGSVGDATTVVSRYYERPEFTLTNGAYNSPSLPTRQNVAMDAYNRFASNGVAVGGGN